MKNKQKVKRHTKMKTEQNKEVKETKCIKKIKQSVR